MNVTAEKATDMVRKQRPIVVTDRENVSRCISRVDSTKPTVREAVAADMRDTAASGLLRIGIMAPRLVSEIWASAWSVSFLQVITLSTPENYNNHECHDVTSCHVTTHQQETSCHDKWCDEPAGHVEEGSEDGAQGEAETECGVHQGVNFARTVWKAKIIAVRKTMIKSFLSTSQAEGTT